MTEASELLEFLRARLTEDERVARAATRGPWLPDSDVYAERISSTTTDVIAGGRWGGEASVFASTEDAIHIARHDPARVLAEVAAKRAILADHERFVAERRRLMGGWDTGEAGPILIALASVYADHPDYREEWRPWHSRQG